MKNVLFATTALVAFAGAASAASHISGPTIAFSGEVTVGYNDEVEGGIYYDANLDVLATVDLGDNVVVTVDGTVVEGDEGSFTYAFNPTVDVTYTGGSITASLTVGDLNDEGASEYFYADRSGMAQDVENHDDSTNPDARALVMFGDFGVAVGCDGVQDTVCDGINVGAGATFGSIEIGVGYDDSANAGGAVTAVSADATLGSFDVGVSYATGTEDSIGVEVGTTMGAVEVGAYYASNSSSSDAFGVSVDYSAGALTVGAYFDSAATDEYGVDLAYAMNDMLTANAGFFHGAADYYATPGAAAASVVDDYYYVGMDYAVNDNITATVSYANGDSVGSPEYVQGISAFITASF